jgi:ribosomal protein S21
MTNVEVKIKKIGDPKINLDKALKRLKTKLVIEGTLEVARAKRRFETAKKKRERKIKEQINKRKILGF